MHRLIRSNNNNNCVIKWLGNAQKWLNGELCFWWRTAYLQSVIILNVSSLYHELRDSPMKTAGWPWGSFGVSLVPHLPVQSVASNHDLPSLRVDEEHASCVTLLHNAVVDLGVRRVLFIIISSYNFHHNRTWESPTSTGLSLLSTGWTFSAYNCIGSFLKQPSALDSLTDPTCCTLMTGGQSFTSKTTMLSSISFSALVPSAYFAIPVNYKKKEAKLLKHLLQVEPEGLTVRNV